MPSFIYEHSEEQARKIDIYRNKKGLSKKVDAVNQIVEEALKDIEIENIKKKEITKVEPEKIKP